MSQLNCLAWARASPLCRSARRRAPSRRLRPNGVAAAAQKATEERLGVVIVDHGSRRPNANVMLESFVELYREQTGRDIVEPAHMELAEPSISNAFDACVMQGATTVVVSPYFLSPGRHWNKPAVVAATQDIPALTEEAAAKHPDVKFLVSAPIGLHKLVAQVLDERLEHCLAHAAGDRAACDMCAGTDRCKLATATPPES